MGTLTVTIGSPQPNDWVKTSAPVPSIKVNGSASLDVSKSHIDSVTVTVGSDSYTPIDAVNGPKYVSWSQTLTPPSGWDLKITVDAGGSWTTGGAGGTTEHTASGSASVTLRADNTPPLITVISPVNGVQFSGTSQGFTLHAVGTVTDQQSGVQWVNWSLEDGSNGSIAFGSDGAWAVDIPLQPGPHVITITAQDKVGNVASVALSVQVDVPTDIFGASPQEYLQALLEFATNPADSSGKARVGFGGRNLTTDDLETTLYRHFVALADKVNVRKATESVSRIRMAIEVLRQYLLAHPVSDAVAGQLVADELQYRQTAYFMLLQQIGTSFDEVRLMRVAPQSDRQVAAERLGITLRATRPDELDSLLLDPATITEAALETLFGLVDSTRYPLYDGVKLTDNKWLTGWNFTGVSAGRNTDADGFVYLIGNPIIKLPPPRLPLMVPPTTPFHVGVSTGLHGGSLVALGTADQDLIVNLGALQNSNLGGRLMFAKPITDQIRISIAPSVLTWRLNQLRVSWRQEDSASGLPPTTPPIIDPDLLFPDDFLNQNTADAAFALYLNRQDALQAWSHTLQAKRPDINALLSGVLVDTDHPSGWTVSDVLLLDQSRVTGNDISSTLAVLNLNVDAFDRLVALCRIYSTAGVSQLLETEWSDIVAILVQVQKRQQYSNWRAEEAAASHKVTLSPDWFVARGSIADEADLPRWRATSRARSNWLHILQGRQHQQDAVSQALRQAVEATENGAISLLRDALVNAIQVTMPILSLYGTGLDADGHLLAAGAVDPHWAITSGPAISGTAPAFVTLPGYPVGNPWIANDANSRWISPQPSEQTGDAPGDYTYSTTFDLTGFDPASVRITASVAVDDSVTQVRLNGSPLGLSVTGFTVLKALSIGQGFVTGRNVLEFAVNNAATMTNPSGLRVQMTTSGTFRPGVDWLSERLLLDVGVTAQKTSRLDQAIETMQELFFTLREQGFPLIPELSAWLLREDTSQFDEEWKWMGAYSTWATAVNVFLYPENLLLPIVRTNGAKLWGPSAEFQKNIAKAVREAAPLSPESARTIATDYVKNLQSDHTDLPAELQGTIQLTDLLSDSELKQRAVDLKGAWTTYTTTSPNQASLNYLAEVYYFVPMHLALQLCQDSQFGAALDWYRTIYNYDLPAANRKIWYGLVAEESVPTNYVQALKWLAVPLNPHTIVGLNPTDPVPSNRGQRARAYSRFTLQSLAKCLLAYADSEFSVDSFESLPRARNLYLQALDILGASDLGPMPVEEGKIPPNPLLDSLRQHAKLNLVKLRTGRSISGMSRDQESMQKTNTDTAFQPTQYRYATLIDRAKQLVALAQQAESSFLASLEKKDAETYTALKAQQDMEVANANVLLQNLMTSEAADSTLLAEDQFARSQIQVDHFYDLINSDISGLEMASIAMHIGEAASQGLAASLYGAATGKAIATAVMTEGASEAITSLFGGGGLTEKAAQASSAAAQAFAANAGVLSALASYEEKQKDWQFQLGLAKSDRQISLQQATIAMDHESVVQQQQAIATIQSQHANDVVTFLTTQKFTNAVLYEWMSGILQQVYSYLLQQATAVARLAQTQLAFERQESLINIVHANYWQAPSDAASSTVGGTQPSDARGLTGSARLLADITRLDQYAFATDQRKLQLTKSISLAQWDPFTFQNFQATGLLRFATTSRPFDQDFPGHYLRIIKRVRISVIALVPALQGIHATLFHTGVSRVVLGGDAFSEIILRREPQTVALTAPINASGLFELDVQPELLLPFEGLGVVGSWEFVMPKAANQFDYSSIADVVITMDYTALNSPDYRQQVIRQLGRSVSADRAYNLRQDFADAWYNLNNPAQSSTPMKVTIESKRTDFPVNLADDTLTIEQLLLYFVPADGATFQVQATLTLEGKDVSGTARTVSGAATTIDEVISTRRGNASSWAQQMIGMRPAGKWTLDLSSPDARNLFQGGQIQDILFVVTYNGDLPIWPS